MLVRVLCFAHLRDLVGRDEEAYDLPAQTDADAIRAAVATRHPAAQALLRRSLVAVDHAYARGSVALHEGSEIALIPPVSGG